MEEDKEITKGAGGRPTEYDPKNNEMVTNYCLMGATDEELGSFLGVSERTINYWKGKHPEFLQSIKEGKERADARISSSLYQRALGYTTKETKAFVINGEIVTKEIDKHYPPDTTAAIFWNKNRRPANFKDKQEVEVKTTKEVFIIGGKEFVVE